MERKAFGIIDNYHSITSIIKCLRKLCRISFSSVHLNRQITNEHGRMDDWGVDSRGRVYSYSDSYLLAPIIVIPTDHLLMCTGTGSRIIITKATVR